MSAAGSHSCGLRIDDTITCWGGMSGWVTTLADGTKIVRAPTGRFSAVTAGGAHSCGLRTDGTIECWGNNEYGQADTPAGRFSAVTLGGDYSCGLRTNGTITCWGANGSGQVTGRASVARIGHFGDGGGGSG